MRNKNIGIINSGMGNIESIKNILKKVRTRVDIINDPKELQNFDAIILPGIGHFDEGVKRLTEQNWFSAIQKYHQDKRGLMVGICLGMQLLAEKSEEGKLQGLGLIKGRVAKFDFSNSEQALKIPHMGWNTLKPVAGRAWCFEVYWKRRSLHGITTFIDS